MRPLYVLVVSISLLLLSTGCRTVAEQSPPVIPADKDYSRPLPPGMSALRKIEDPARLPDFRAAFSEDPAGLLAAVELSLRYFGAPSSRSHYPVQGISHARAMASLVQFRSILASSRTPEEFHARILQLFDVYESVGCGHRGTVLFTGYYTPIFEARLTPTEEYRWPLHRLPDDLVKDAAGRCQGRRISDGSLVPYYTRGEIDAGAIEGHEFVYLKNRFEAYICTVQGSAHLRLPDGSMFRVGYHANNGRDYTSVGQLLVADGLMPAARLSLSGLIAFFAQRPEIMDEYLSKNERYVFFQPTDLPPTGSLGVPVTPYRSIATDKAIFPRGCLAFVATDIPHALRGGDVVDRPFDQFVLDQDAGGAIRAPGRCDIYLGVGESAGNVAGWMYREGRLFYLFLKE